MSVAGLLCSVTSCGAKFDKRFHTVKTDRLSHFYQFFDEGLLSEDGQHLLFIW